MPSDERRSKGSGERRGRLPAGLALPVLLLATTGASASGPSAPAGDPAYGEYLASQCVTCHRRPGATDGSIPPIAGLPQPAFVDALLEYKDGRRDNQVMRNVTSALGIDEIAALAAYFGSLSPD